MSENFKNMCLELVDEPEKLAQFIKLYCGTIENSDYSECKLCGKKLEDKYLDDYCDLTCKFDYIIKNYDDKDIMTEIINNQDELLKCHYRFNRYFLRYDLIKKILFDKNLKIRNCVLETFFRYFKSYYGDKNFIGEGLEIEDFAYARYDLPICNIFIKKFSIQKIIESKENLKILISLNDYKINNYFKEYLELEDVNLIVDGKNYELAKFFIDKFTLECVTEKYPELWKKIRYLKMLKLFELDSDDKIIYFIQNMIFLDDIDLHFVSDSNLLFSTITREIMDKVTNGNYSKNWYIFVGKFAKFIDNNAKYIKCEITKSTLETFFNNMKCTSSDFCAWLGYLIAKTKKENIAIEKFNYQHYINSSWSFDSYIKLYELGAKLNDHTIYSLMDCFTRSNVAINQKNSREILTHYKQNNSVENGLSIYKSYLLNNLPKFYDTAIRILKEANII